MTPRLKSMLIRHEGVKLKAYKDTVGLWTIGVGRNIEQTGITMEEARILLDNDVKRTFDVLSKFSWFKNLDDVRQDALVDMAFMGVGNVLEFKKMIAALERKDFETAAEEMLNSKWAGQVKGRAVELAAMIKTGNYQA